MHTFRPVAWFAAEAEDDTSWIQRLSAEEVAGFDAALAHAKTIGRTLLEMVPDDFPLNAAARDALKRAVDTTQDRWGMCLLKGFPVHRWSEDETRLAYWGMGLHLGVARTQNRASDILNDVRDVGSVYKTTNGRGYNTNASLDFHMDSCDVVGLLCRRAARQGGESKVVSSIAVFDEMRRRRPDLAEALRGPFYFSYQGAQDPAQPPYYCCPIIGNHAQCFAMRTNRKNIVAAQRDFDEVPRLSDEQNAALDLLDELMTDPRYCFSMSLEPGDLQLLNNYVTIHSRTGFDDYEEPDMKRHLLRLWLAVPNAQPLPDNWLEYFGDVRAGAVRGGLRGSHRSAAFEAYEKRQAAHMGMTLREWTPMAFSATAA
ncbi:TauD/TfdA family dioxygenase [Paraburkholderia panacisoli]|uniref:TauD/TfdA family dioxygenase n=1 Tax=Paraburkholderia panacisoli TaxID=2603818 RepID=A0A5B0G9I3_9BURK|nr:TauD/TfdA family dioxygenase [Paraburkholderia panacisoli]KAA0999355.1 TauD/TfdA family dioxygenase [Paraburkholderia panacisoli]